MNTKNLFKVDEVIGVSKFRIYFLRFYYALIILALGIEVWTRIITQSELWEPYKGIAFSFWASFSLLAILGLIHPLKMLPLLLVQILYKIIWLLLVGYPLMNANQLTGAAHGLAETNMIGVVVDIIVIPWPYIFRNYILRSKPIISK